MAAKVKPNSTNVSGDAWIKIKDFEETAIWITGRNATTDTIIKKSVEINMSEISEQGMTLKLPKKSCSSGHFLILSFLKGKKLTGSPDSPDKKNALTITVTAKVTDVDPLDAEYSSAILQLYQFNQDEWRSLLNELSERQNRFQDVFKRIKGDF